MSSIPPTRAADRVAHVALVTCLEPGEHVRDQAPTVAALEAGGHSVEVVPWDDPAPTGRDWPDPDVGRFDLVLPRSTWNYHLNAPAFLRWIDRAAQRSEVWNRPAAIRANHHKRYLTTLAQRGVRTAPTVLVPRGAGVALAAIRAARGWNEVVIKPAVGASSFATRAFPAGGSRGDRELRPDARSSGDSAGRGGRKPDLDAQADAFFRESVAERDTLVQPLIPAFRKGLERSIIWIDGEITHVVSRRFRTEGEHDVASLTDPPSEAERLLVAQCLHPLTGLLMYARLDVVPGPDGSPMVSELELIEPSLYLDLSPEAVERFVAAVDRRVTHSGPRR